MKELTWTLLVYKLPSHPTKYRLNVWRKLQALGAVYLQDGVAALPTRDDLEENLGYVASFIAEQGGSFNLLRGQALIPGEDEKLVRRFQEASAQKYADVTDALNVLIDSLEEAVGLERVCLIEDEIKKTHLTFLRVFKTDYFPSGADGAVRQRFKDANEAVTALTRGSK